MNDLIELVFENIPDERLNEFTRVLMGGSAILTMEASEAGHQAAEWDGDVAKVLNGSSANSAAVSLRLEKVDWPRLSILNPLLQIIKYDGLYDVILSFTPKDITCGDSNGAIESIHLSAMDYLAISGAKTVYCGYEPATDERTRFFSNGSSGPIFEFW